MAVVSWPARKSVIASSRSCLSVMPAAVLVARLQQHREQVVARPRPAARRCGDEPIDDLVEPRGRGPGAAVARAVGTQSGRKIEAAERVVKACITSASASPTSGASRRDVGVEERLGDDLQRQAHHLLVQVAHLAVAPAVQQPLGVGHHGLGVGGQALAVKSGGDEPALAPPEVALARQQPVAEQEAALPQGGALT